MFLKMGQVTVNLNTVCFAEPTEDKKGYEVTFLGGVKKVIPAEHTGGYFSDCPSVTDFRKMQEAELSRGSSPLVRL